MERKKYVIIILLIPFFVFWHWFEPAAKKNKEGIQSYLSKKYDDALKQFMSAKGIKPDMAELKNNTASALYQMKKYQEALEEFSQIDPFKTNIPKAEFYYNLGNSYFRLNQFDKALKNYKKSLIENPEDMDTKKNYELALKKQQEQNQDKKKNEDKKQDQKQDQKKDQKQDQKKDQQQQQQQQEQKPEQKYQSLMQYLNQNEKKQLKEKKRAVGIVKKEKDW